MGSTSAAGDFDSFYSSSCFTALELDVAGILFNLPNLLNYTKSSPSSYQFPSLWGSKKKRSAGKLGGASTSPTAPMDFPSPVASDSKPLPPKNRLPSASGLKEELLSQCQRLTASRDQLQREIKQVEARRHELMAQNQILREKTRQQVGKASSVALPFTQFQPHCQRHPLIVVPYQQRKTGDLEGYPRPLSESEYRYRLALVAMAKSKAAAAAMARRNRRLIQKAKNSSRLPRGRK